MEIPKQQRARGRPRAFDVQVALDRAVEVFWKRGYVGAPLSELTATMGITPPSLYAAFGDKRGLFLAALDRYAATAGAAPLAALRLENRPAHKLRAFLRAAVDLAYDGSHGRGCLAACVAADAAGDDEVIRERLGTLLRDHDAALGEATGGDAPSGRVLLGAMHAIAVRARAGAPRGETEKLASDLLDQLERAA